MLEKVLPSKEDAKKKKNVVNDLLENFLDCRGGLNEGAHVIFKKDMTNAINKGKNVTVSTQNYIEVMASFAKNCGSCDAEMFKRFSSSIFNSTINPVFPK